MTEYRYCTLHLAPCTLHLAPCLLRSPLLRTMETVVFSPLLVLGLMHQSQKVISPPRLYRASLSPVLLSDCPVLQVAVHFFDTFQPDPHSVARAFHLELKSRLVRLD